MVDSGYPNTKGYLAPFMDPDARYHMPDYRSNRNLRGILEQFNYRHSSLRTTVERAFANLKGRWQILDVMPQMKEKWQMSIIVASITLNNFIHMERLGIPIVEHDSNVQGTADSDLFNSQ